MYKTTNAETPETVRPFSRLVNNAGRTLEEETESKWNGI